ncbi:5-formyltetrahydrofolate cyclo-ligase [Rhodobacteraceae bacterium CCMM004]|nr:5-formyltetrahydrofolate cyclo-ligase [Rhodobacteraceae bacterium CCMM004]
MPLRVGPLSPAAGPSTPSCGSRHRPRGGRPYDRLRRRRRGSQRVGRAGGLCPPQGAPSRPGRTGDGSGEDAVTGDQEDAAALKAAARQAAFARRKAAHAALGAGAGAAALAAALAPWRGRPLAGYLPIRTEIDPRPAMAEAARHGPVAVPVIEGPGKPLRFRRWTPEAALVEGPFGVAIPAEGPWIVPEVLIVPLLAFDARGWRLGYGGGYYDRTLAGLRAAGPVHALGFAFAAQEVPHVPTDPTDAPLDGVVTERGPRPV